MNKEFMYKVATIAELCAQWRSDGGVDTIARYPTSFLLFDV